MTLQELIELADAADYRPSIHRDETQYFASVRAGNTGATGHAAGSSYAEALQKAIDELDKQILLGEPPRRVEAPF